VWNYIAKEKRASGRANGPVVQRRGRQAGRISSSGAGRTEFSGTREPIPHDSYRLGYEIAGETLWVPRAGPYPQAVAA
jgi:hypothetical protein